MKIRILVYGFYGKNNLGDDLFVTAFNKLFPLFDFVFTDHITSKHLENIDAVFLGGGSFLGETLKISDDKTFELLKQQKIFYIGVGTETNIDPKHLELLKLAKLIASRSNNIDKIKAINSNSIIIPDLILSLNPSISNSKNKKSVLVMPNISVVPNWKSPHWQHSAWQYFKSEFCQFLDELIQQKYNISFLPFCVNDNLNDNYAAIEIINGMFEKNITILNKQDDIENITKTISQYEIVISQRFHGIILSKLSKTPCLTIYHHDKLKDADNNGLSYYGINKKELFQKFNLKQNENFSDILPIDPDIFSDLTQTIVSLLI